jgi:hypothetical protein
MKNKTSNTAAGKAAAPTNLGHKEETCH